MFAKVSISLIILLFGFGKSEFFTATDSLKQLIYTQDQIIKTIENFISSKEKKIEELRRYVEIYKQEQSIAVDDPQMYIENPINAFILIKRLTTDWQQIENLVKTDLNIDPLKSLKRNIFPSDEDLTGAGVAVNRIIFMYLLNISLIANGELNGVKYNQKLSTADCFELGRQSYLNEYYNSSFLWLQEAESRLAEETYSTVDINEILENMVLTCMKQDKHSLALHFNNRLLKINPNHHTAMENKAYLEVLQNSDISYNFHISKKFFFGVDIDVLDKNNYHKLCREKAVPRHKTHKLKCKYFNNNIPFLFLAPFKMEEAYLDPDIYLFHDVIGDREIETLKRLAYPRFTRAGVATVETHHVEYRICKSSFLEDRLHKYIADLSKRIADMTGLTIESAEDFQILNYGIGGHYEAHRDMLLDHSIKKVGDRIATVLFYMSDVSGGATVFPHIGASFRPKKGTAVVWFNLHNSGDADVRTVHAACPVLVGSKWVATKWLHEIGQEFQRPCPLTKPPMHN